MFIDKEYRGNIKWTNDWLCFMSGVLAFLIHKNMENNGSPVEIRTIHQIFIDPSKFQDFIGKGMYKTF